MKNFKVINRENLLYNLEHFSGKKIIAMVKANAYGHGLKEIVCTIENKVDGFGVVNTDEARQVRKLTDKKILVCSKVDDFRTCKNLDLDILIDDEVDLLRAISFGLEKKINLNINCGMNRFGVKSELALQGLNRILEEKNIKLQSICTHFPRTESRSYTRKNYERFLLLKSKISQNPQICFGGSGIFDYGFDYDFLRLGLGLYGYGYKNLRKVMSIYSHVSKILFAKKGEYIGYGKKFCVLKDGFFVVPVGYGDGLRRALSGKFDVKINQKVFCSVGNICMDAFFVEVDNSVKVGDEVEVMCDAEIFAKECGTISYEILTGFSNLRGKTIVKD